MAQIVVEEGVQVVTTGAGSPGKYIPMWKAAGHQGAPRGGGRRAGQAAGEAGQPTPSSPRAPESGGHVGEMTTMALVPQVVDAVDRARHRRRRHCRRPAGWPAALALGACGVQVGTCLLASLECPIHENYKLALLKAKDSDTTVTGRSIGGAWCGC